MQAQMQPQQPFASYNPTPFHDSAAAASLPPVAAADGTVEAAAGVMPNGSVYTPGTNMPISARQKQNQQLLRQSISSPGSRVSAMRRSTAYTGSTDAFGSVDGGAGGGDGGLPFVPYGSTSPLDVDDGGEHAVDGYASRGGTTSAASQQQQPLQPQDAGLTPLGEDFVHEVLAMNTLAMEQCYAALGAAASGTGGSNATPVTGSPSPSSTAAAAAGTEEPMNILQEAFMRLDETSAQDLPAALLDQLKATTLNNMGVVECNRGQPRQALSHFEAARQLEENNDMASPSVALNTCAAYNALRMYDKATAAALEAVDMLRNLEAQRERSRRAAAALARQQRSQQSHGGTAGSSSIGSTGARERRAERENANADTELLLESAAAPQIADSQNAALWGAAWNNLAVAQINTAREAASRDTSEYTNTLALFQNAMQATQDLLGIQHPMSRAVVETYRSVRRALRHHGAFKQHRTMLRAPLPPVDPREQSLEDEQLEVSPGQTRHGALEKQRQQLTITFRGDVTGGQKLVERVDSTPYPGAPSQPYKARKGGHDRTGSSTAASGSASRSSSNKKAKKGSKRNTNKANAALLRGMPHSETLTRASAVYGNPHPLLYSPPPRHGSGSAPTSPPGSARTTNTARSAPTDGAYERPPPHSQKGNGVAATTGRNGGGSTGSSRQQPARPSPPPQHTQQQRAKHPHQQQPRDSLTSAMSSASARQPGRGVSSSGAGANGALLPPITSATYNGPLSSEQSWAEDQEEEMDRSTATAASTVFMHAPPPPRSSQQQQQQQSQQSQFAASYPIPRNPQDTAATAAQLHQAKMLLLAAPPPQGSMSSSGRPAMGVGPSAVEPFSNGIKTSSSGAYPSPAAGRSATESKGDTNSGPARNTASTPPGRDAQQQQHQHELFQGMWVTADPHYIHRGPRVFGRPAYYTISSVLEIAEDGVSGGVAHKEAKPTSVPQQERHSATAPAGTAALTSPHAMEARPVLPTLTYSSSSSEGDGDRDAAEDSASDPNMDGGSDVN